jgi:hypothetical protein
MTLLSAPSSCAGVNDFTKPSAVSTRLLAAAKRGSDASKAATSVHAEISRLTDLADETEHIGIKPILQESRFLNLVSSTMRGSLVDDPGQRGKLLDAGGYREYDIYASPRVGIYG